MTADSTRGVYVNALDLAALEGAARHVTFKPRRRIGNLLAGRHASRLRGRGLDFEELRQYLPGDDVRTIDWHVTARAGKPFVRVYKEEKDRPSIIVLDQRINMFFGTKLAMKSVTAAEAAAMCAWRIQIDGDRVGGIVFDDQHIHDHRPQRTRGSLLRFLDLIVERNRALNAKARVNRNPAQFNLALEAADRAATRDHVVFVISDCDGMDAGTRDRLRRLRRRNDVVLLLVDDPFLTHLPESGALVVSDGELQVELTLGARRLRQSISEGTDARLKEILAWQRELGVIIGPISAAEDAADQLRRLLARPNARGARR